MERCEEKLLISAFYEIEPRIPPGQLWKEDFLDHFYQHGNGVKFDTISCINAERRRQNLDPIEFRQTTVYEYARSANRIQKSELRRQMRDEFMALDTADRARWRREAEEQTDSLLPPHITFEELKAQREFRPPLAALTVRERAMRFQATEPQPAAFAPPPPEARAESPTLTRAIRQLKLARRPETIAMIIANLAPDDALDVAESGQIEDADMIDALVARSLAPVGDLVS
jgi:hypothetical protein